MIDPDKYIVFNRQEFNAWWNQPMIGGSHHAIPSPNELDDALVIRKRDVFAASALYTYAHSIQTAIEILNNSGISIETMDTDFLQELADFFAGEADDASKRVGKVPD